MHLVDESASAAIDLDAYCARIGYDGPREPTLAVLSELHRLHPPAIPFEGIDVRLGRGVELEPAALQAKLLAGCRGGYCFEQNTLFRLALVGMGFDVATLIARSRWGRPLERPRARSHLTLRVRIDGEDWLADVGSRADMLAPLRMADRGAQGAGFEPLRLAPAGEELRLEMLVAGAWAPVYDIVPAPQLDVDIAAANWFTATHPSSPFRQQLIAWRTNAHRRLVLADNRLTVREAGRAAVRVRLSAEELERALAEDFGLAVEPAWRPMLREAVAAGDGEERRT